jgi:hypothetical protein
MSGNADATQHDGGFERVGPTSRVT